jgi:hypothetical protein
VVDSGGLVVPDGVGVGRDAVEPFGSSAEQEVRRQQSISISAPIR